MAVIDSAAKSASVVLSKVCSSGRAERAVRGLLAYGHFVIGQGAGSGWDRKSEYASAIRSLKGMTGGVTVVDVGANNGSWLIGLLDQIGDRVEKAVAAECAPIPLEVLRATNDSRFEIIGEAVGAEVGTATFHHQSVGGGLASLYERRDTIGEGHEWKPSEVSVTTIDALRERFGLERIDFLKMDVEGAEHDVLLGAAGSIKQGLIGSIQFEFGSGNINSKAFFKDIWELLSENFDLYRIAPGGVEHRIDSYYEDLEYYRGATNYVARCRRIKR